MIEITKEDILNDVNENNIALKYALKYVPEVITDDMLEVIVSSNKFAIRHIPKERITNNMIKNVIDFKDPRCLEYVPKEMITDELENIILTTFTYTGLRYYMTHFKERLTIEKVKTAVEHCKKSHRIYLKRAIPEYLLTEEILDLIPGDMYFNAYRSCLNN